MDHGEADDGFGVFRIVFVVFGSATAVSDPGEEPALSEVERVRSTIQRLGSTAKPLVESERLTTSILHPAKASTQFSRPFWQPPSTQMSRSRSKRSSIPMIKRRAPRLSEMAAFLHHRLQQRPPSHLLRCATCAL